MTNIKRHTIYFLSFVLIFMSMSVFNVEQASALTSTSRLAGGDRYTTAVEISKSGWQASQNVVLATGEDFPDALCAAPLARQLDAPILLTGRNSMDNALKNELSRLSARNIYIIGGAGVVSQGVENELRQGGRSVERIAGRDRYETSIAVANYISGHFNMGSQIVVATGDDFPDALSIAPVAASKGMAIILSPKNVLNDNLRTYISQKGITGTYVIGGAGVISDRVKDSLPGSERVWGPDRYSTNAAIISRFANDMKFDTTYLATGNNFPDALSGSALAPKTQSPVVLVDNALTAATKNLIAPKLKFIEQIKVLGGTGAVSESALDSIKSLVKGNTSGNIINGGFVGEEKGYIFYNNTGLYKSSIDGIGVERISQDDPMFINIVNGWIYYFNGADEGNLYKMKIDGSMRTKLTDDMAIYVTVAGDFIYYSNQSDDGCLYKIKTDGTGRVKLSNEYASDINVDGDFIYYSSGNSESEKKLFRIKNDGTGKAQIGYDSVEYINISGDFIYYRNITDNSRLYRMKTDGSGKQGLTDGAVQYINVSGDFIYYSNMTDNGKLYKMSINGGAITRINEDNTIFINVAGDWIYYINGADEKLYKVRTDASSRQIVQ